MFPCTAFTYRYPPKGPTAKNKNYLQNYCSKVCSKSPFMAVASCRIVALLAIQSFILLGYCEAVSCAPGSFSPNGLAPCTPCNPGSYAPAPAATACKYCPRNYFQADYGQSACQPCASSYFTNKIGKAACYPCPAGFGSALPGSACLRCPRNTFSRGNGRGCQACGGGGTSEPGSSKCLCPAGLTWFNDIGCATPSASPSRTPSKSISRTFSLSATPSASACVQRDAVVKAVPDVLRLDDITCSRSNAIVLKLQVRNKDSVNCPLRPFAFTVTDLPSGWTIGGSGASCSTFQVKIVPDAYPAEIYWEV